MLNFLKLILRKIVFFNLFVILYLHKPCFYLNEDYNKYLRKNLKKTHSFNISFKNNQHKSNSIF